VKKERLHADHGKPTSMGGGLARGGHGVGGGKSETESEQTHVPRIIGSGGRVQGGSTVCMKKKSKEGVRAIVKGGAGAARESSGTQNVPPLCSKGVWRLGLEGLVVPKKTAQQGGGEDWGRK